MHAFSLVITYDLLEDRCIENVNTKSFCLFTVGNGRVPYFLTFVDDHIKLSHFQIQYILCRKRNFQAPSREFLLLRFAFVNTYKHIIASNNKMYVKLTFGRKHEKCTQKDFK